MTPYLAGTKKAECMPIKKTVDSTRYGPKLANGAWPRQAVPKAKPPRATRVMPTSANFQKTSDCRLL